MGTNADKRARQNENRAAAGAAPSGARRTRTRLIVIGVVAIALVVAVVLALTRGDDTTTGKAASSTTSKSLLPAPPAGISLTKATPCPPAEGSAKRVKKFSGPPPMCTDPAKNNYTATFDTSEGSFTAELAAQTAPVTVNNFVVLSRYHYYDGTPFHRIVPGFVIQGGDGDGDPWGTNDLGYTIPDELPASSEAYGDDTLAMANSGPNSGASQFFVVLPGGGPQLGPSYSLFGKVTEGQDVVAKIGSFGDSAEKPTKSVVIKKLTINETPR